MQMHTNQQEVLPTFQFNEEEAKNSSLRGGQSLLVEEPLEMQNRVREIPLDLINDDNEPSSAFTHGERPIIGSAPAATTSHAPRASLIHVSDDGQESM